FEAMSKVWERGVSLLQGELDPQIYSAYIKPLRFCSYDSDNSELTVSAPSRLVCNHVDSIFKDKIQALMSAELDIPSLKLRFSVGDAPAVPEPVRSAPVVVKKIKLKTKPPTPEPEAQAG